MENSFEKFFDVYVLLNIQKSLCICQKIIGIRFVLSDFYSLPIFIGYVFTLDYTIEILHNVRI